MGQAGGPRAYPRREGLADCHNHEADPFRLSRNRWSRDNFRVGGAAPNGTVG